jgi:hypothetical protein
MSFKDNFCSSPWFHMRINSTGTYEPCRWMTKSDSEIDFDQNIKKISPLVYFQKNMSDLRQQFLNGHAPNICTNCRATEQHNKVSGRQRQLLKSGVSKKYFEKSMLSSPFKSAFDYSNNNQGHTQQTVADWQIDLGNYCNSACIFCSPKYSSSLATEFKKLGLIDSLPSPVWCNDPALLDKFIKDLEKCSNIHYLHFIGGETLITPGFKKILSALIHKDLAKNITIGFTTNLTVWSEPIVELLKQFQQVNLGMSVETLTAVNDYVRYPSSQEQTKKILNQWVTLGKQQDWLMQLRITPTCLTVHDLDTVYQYAWQNKLSVESNNFLDRPECLRISVLPVDQRNIVIEKLQKWIDQHPIEHSQQIVNTRNPETVLTQIVQDASSYLDYLKKADYEDHRLPDLVDYLKQLESNRKNSILDYLPQYENLFRSAGY